MMAVFLDAAYAIALSSENDQYHDGAVALAEKMAADETRIITTRAIILEIGNALAKLRYRKASIELLNALEEDPGVEIIPISEELYRRALEYYQDHQDKEWGITDCISFVVMQDRGLWDALTTDEHFRQAGFRPLLRGI